MRPAGGSGDTGQGGHAGVSMPDNPRQLFLEGIQREIEGYSRPLNQNSPDAASVG